MKFCLVGYAHFEPNEHIVTCRKKTIIYTFQLKNIYKKKNVNQNIKKAYYNWKFKKVK